MLDMVASLWAIGCGAGKLIDLCFLCKCAPSIHCTETGRIFLRSLVPHRRGRPLQGITMPDNKAFVQSLYAAFGRGDIPFILAHLDDAIAWVSNCSSDRIPWGGTRKGRAGAQSFFQALADHLDFELFDPREFAADGDLVVVHGRTVAKVKQTSRRFDSDWVHLFTIAGGRVTRWQEFYDTDAILAALRP